MGHAIREISAYDQKPIKEFLVQYQEEIQPEIWDIQLEAGLPQAIANKNLCETTQYAQTFLVTPIKGMAYIHGKSTKMTVCVDNSQNPLIIDSGAHCSIVGGEYLAKNFPKWEKQLFSAKEKNFEAHQGR
ncbi:hypothetical protein O181_022985 [Austropuccinia psidii MF-1]|uniref:Uncharacterized protein n=1 Tax=Austropuccinia psidii MF-1 TaxID=1389203 RepID=A0A9Q3CIE2_9BASI|nr:hypothetical protein [Austropuccinia psidii MF-1]